MAERSCTACHTPHGENIAGFLLAAFSNSAPDQAGANKCLDCHVFDSVNTPHKANTCAGCHTAHKGHNMPVSKMTDVQCNACHKVKIKNFSRGHPKFEKNYPHNTRTSINFDHTKHLNIYFKDERHSKNAPESKCIACHNVSKASRNVPVRSFEQVCASCHAKEIQNRDFTLFEMPELLVNPVDIANLTEVCRMTPEETDEGEEFMSVSAETPNALIALLFELEVDDAEAYTSVIGEILTQAIDAGAIAFEAAIREWEGSPSKLLAGLSPTSMTVRHGLR